MVGKECSIDLIIDDLIEELRDRPCELVSVAGGMAALKAPRGSAIQLALRLRRAVEGGATL